MPNHFFRYTLLLLCLATPIVAQVPDTSKLVMTEWAKNGMTRDPVALAFDHQGRLYLAESARRGTVDIDIRSHKTWLLDDLASDDFESMRSFFRRQMSPELSATNREWLQDRNGDGSHDYRDLMSITERIRLLEDTDQDGVADKSTVFADGFNEEFTGVAAGVMPLNGDVYFTVYPDLWRLRDTDGDGVADERYSMFRGFGVHAAFDGHDLHGLTVGPEGKIYFSCGDNGFSVQTQEGERLHYPNTGGVLRMNPDGSELEVFAVGLRNVQEFDFDKYGNMFAVDNDGDLEDERERAVYIAEGSDSGWRLNWQFRAAGWSQYNGGMTYNPWVAEGMWKPQHPQQPANITPPMQNYSVGPGGFKFNPGTALNDQYRDFFFCVQFPVQKITAFRTQPKGAGFEMVDEHLFNGGLMVSSLNFGPDGGCYLADWIGKWQPNTEGIVYRVDDPAVQGSQLRKEVQGFINHGVGEEPVARLEQLLGHPDRRVRHLAQTELVGRRHGAGFIRVANDKTADQMARIHALWGLIQLDDSSHARWLAGRLPWDDADPQIRQQCARVAGDMQLVRSESYLLPLLKDDAPLVRSHAAIALGKVGSTSSTAALLSLLEDNADRDPFIRHAAVYGLTRCGSEKQLLATLDAASTSVRLGAVLALRRQKSPQIISFLQDKDTRVLREAVRGIHDDFSIPTALPAVAALLDSRKLPEDEPTLRRVLSANLRVGDRAAAYRLVNFVRAGDQHGSLSRAMKLEALECLAAWTQSPLIDRVEGRVRTTERAEPDAARLAMRASLGRILASADNSVSSAAIMTATRLGIEIEAPLVREWVRSKQIATPTRVDLLWSLAKANDGELDALLEEILAGQLSPRGSELWKTAFTLLIDRRPEEAWARIDLASPLGQKQFFIDQLARFKNTPADTSLTMLAADHVAESTDNGRAATLLDVLYAVRKRKLEGDAVASLEKLVREREYGEYSFAELGGDTKRGEEIYRTHVSAQCIRCHAAGGKGKQAGPELNGIGKKGSQYLLESLVNPSKVIAKGFEGVTIVTDDGTLVTGTIVSEDDQSIIVGQSDGKQIAVAKAEIEERSAADTSAMPKMTDVLSPLQIRDVVAYLSTLVE